MTTTEAPKNPPYIALYVTEAVRERIREVATAEGRSMSNWIRSVVFKALEK